MATQQEVFDTLSSEIRRIGAKVDGIRGPGPAIIGECPRDGREYTKAEISRFLAAQRKTFTQEQWRTSYQSWNRGERAWVRYSALLLLDQEIYL